jgi:hypothetical protein
VEAGKNLAQDQSVLLKTPPDATDNWKNRGVAATHAAIHLLAMRSDQG